MLRAVRLGMGILAGVCAVGSTGCSTMNNTEKGALVGGGVGSIVGTAIGAATGNPRTGAAVGALGGATLGALAGSDQDRVEQAEAQQAIAQQQSQLGMIDVVNLSHGGTDPQVIAAQIRNTRSTFNLSTTDIEYLTQQNVSPLVIRAMQDSRAPVSGRPVIVREAPVIIERPVYPVYGPPMIGFHYSRRFR